jgi:hypothetical protein
MYRNLVALSGWFKAQTKCQNVQTFKRKTPRYTHVLHMGFCQLKSAKRFGGG